MTRLPDKLSDLIDLAVKDGRRLDREMYLPNYQHWHFPAEDDRCRVCLAGAVIAETLGANPHQRWYIRDSDGNIRKKLRALNAVRQGYLSEALRIMSPETPYYLAIERERHVKNAIPALEWEEAKFINWKSFNALLDWCSKVATELRKLGY